MADFKFNFNFSNENPSSMTDEPLRNDSPVGYIKASEIKLNTTDDILVIGEQMEIESVNTGKIIKLWKRNVSDIIFEFAIDDEMDAQSNITKAIGAKSDLVPGVYEGGIKTWECSLDLVSYLASTLQSSNVDNMKGWNILELGCGSGLPGIFCLVEGSPASVDFQDYNEEVLRLVTAPNICLNIMQPHALSDMVQEIEISRDLLHIIPEKSKFYAGDWGSLSDIIPSSKRYNLILSSETIYNVDGYPKLTRILVDSLADNGIALFACKSIYFGCSGNTMVFADYLSKHGRKQANSMVLRVETVAEFGRESSLLRQIIKVSWKME